MNEPEKRDGYHWCWDRCQWVAIVACEARIAKGRCRMLTKPKRVVSEVRPYFETDGQPMVFGCEETK